MRLNELYDTYRDRVDFFLIYIREAHPANGWQVPNNLIEDIVYDEPTSDEARTEIASACQARPRYRDADAGRPRIDNDVERKYVGLPMRQFLIDAEGRIVYAGAKGPFGWDDEAFEEALKALL